MDNGDRDTLERILELTEENNRMLRKMERMARINTIIRVAYWAFVVSAAIGLFYFVQPYIDQYVGAYNSFKDLLVPQ